jgi:hypothetical protein
MSRSPWSVEDEPPKDTPIGEPFGNVAAALNALSKSIERLADAASEKQSVL